MECKGNQKERDYLVRKHKQQKENLGLSMLHEMFAACAPDVKFVDVTQPNKLGDEK